MTRRTVSLRFAIVVLTAAALTTSCGYQVGGQGDLIPKTVKTIAIPPFRNRTIYYKLNDAIPNALIHEFKARTKYEIVNDRNQADLVLEGEIANTTVSPAVYDPASGKATLINVSVLVNLSLVERASKKILYQKANQEFRESFEISEDPAKYFDEGDFAWVRVSKAVATQLVSLVLEAF